MAATPAPLQPTLLFSPASCGRSLFSTIKEVQKGKANNPNYRLEKETHFHGNVTSLQMVTSLNQASTEEARRLRFGSEMWKAAMLINSLLTTKWSLSPSPRL